MECKCGRSPALLHAQQRQASGAEGAGGWQRAWRIWRLWRNWKSLQRMLRRCSLGDSVLRSNTSFRWRTQAQPGAGRRCYNFAKGCKRAAAAAAKHMTALTSKASANRTETSSVLRAEGSAEEGEGGVVHCDDCIDV